MQALSPRQNIACLCLFYCHYYGRCSNELRYLDPPTQTFRSRTRRVISTALNQPHSIRGYGANLNRTVSTTEPLYCGTVSREHASLITKILITISPWSTNICHSRSHNLHLLPSPASWQQSLLITFRGYRIWWQNSEKTTTDAYKWYCDYIGSSVRNDNGDNFC